MPTFTKVEAAPKVAKKRKPRQTKEEEIDYRSIPGIIIFENEADFLKWQLYGTMPKAKKGKK